MKPQPPDSAALLPVTETRHDLLGPIHKALRLMMADVLVRFGAVDANDDRDLCNAQEALGYTLAACRLHLDHEDRYVHPALEQVMPGASHQALREHHAHREHIDALEGDLRALRSAARHDRARIVRDLYRSLARFVADSLVHMADEERLHGPVLWSGHDDAALVALESRIVADTDPALMPVVLGAMLPALNPDERVGMVSGMRQSMPTDAFEAVMDLAQRVLKPGAWASLARALGRPPHPGLVTT